MSEHSRGTAVRAEMGDILTAAQRSKIRRLSAPPVEENEGGEINVVPFLDIITNTLMFVLATVAVTFTSTIDATPPRRGPRSATVSALDLTVVVVRGGFSLKTQDGNVATGCADIGPGLAVPKRAERYDYEALRTCAAKLKTISPDFASEQAVTVSASPEIPYDVLIATIDAMRRSPEGQELFPVVSFAVVR